MVRGNRSNRVGASRVEALLLLLVGGTLAGLGLMALGGCQGKTSAPATVADGEKPATTGPSAAGPAGKPGLLEVQRRMDCAYNLATIAFAAINFDSATGALPSDNHTDFKGQSFYVQLLDNLELSHLRDKDGKPVADGKAKYYVCPGRRKAEQAPGARDYGYVASEGKLQSVLDAPGTGVPVTTVSNLAGTVNTALLSHIWLPPEKYSDAKPGWASPTGHSVKKGKRGYQDTDSEGAGALGSPHVDGMPCAFVDGHVGFLTYTDPQFREFWDYSNEANKPRKALEDITPKRPRP